MEKKEKQNKKKIFKAEITSDNWQLYVFKHKLKLNCLLEEIQNEWPRKGREGNYGSEGNTVDYTERTPCMGEIITVIMFEKSSLIMFLVLFLWMHK